MKKRNDRNVVAKTCLSRFALVTAGLLAGANVENVYAGPENASVQHGDVTFIQNGNHTIIQASDGSIINYLNFNIDVDEIVQFVQPHDLARVLNRITGPEPTYINGTLTANGIVYLVNPAGVVFGQNSVVDSSGIFAAAGNMSNADFLNGVNRFTDLNGAVINHGHINGEQVHLMGDTVANHGDITSSNGIITMVAGDTVILRQHGERISVEVDGVELTDQSQPQHGSSDPSTTAQPAVENTGTVSNNGGQVVFGAGDMVSLAIRNTGTVEAAGGDITVAAMDGAIHNTGVISASVNNGTAGNVIVQGPSVVNQGEISADSNNGAGGYVELTSQNHTYMLDGSVTSAAGGSGDADGGEILVHSYEGQTLFADGALADVSGGDDGGDGGYVEISGFDIVFGGDVDLDAENGYDDGTLLIDPARIQVVENGDPADDAEFMANNGEVLFSDPDFLVSLSASSLENIMGDVILEATEWIYILAPLNMNGQNMFITSGGEVVILRPIVGANNLTIVAGFGGGANGPVSLAADLDLLGTLDVTGSRVIIGGTTPMLSITTGGDQIYRAPTEICVDTVMTGNEMRFLGSLDSTQFGVASLTTNGTAFFEGPVGTGATGIGAEGVPTGALRAYTANGTANINAGQFITTLGQTYNGLVNVVSDLQAVSLAGGTIAFNDAIMGTGNALDVFTFGDTLFNGPVGADGMALSRVFTDGPGQSFFDGPVFYAQVVDINDVAILTGDVDMFADTSVDFARTVAGNGNSLMIDSPLVGFHGNVTDMDVLRVFSTAGIPQINLSSEGNAGLADDTILIVTGNTVDLDGNVDLFNDADIFGADLVSFGNELDGPFALDVESNTLINFGGDVGQDAPLHTLNTYTDGLVQFGGNNVTAENDITFNFQERTDIPTVATIAGTGGDLTIESLDGDVDMAQNQKLTVTSGDLEIIANNGTARLGDLNSFGDMTVNANDIEIRTRPASDLLNEDGNVIRDDGIDFIAGGDITFTDRPDFLGDGEVAFASGTNTFNGDFGGLNTFERENVDPGEFFTPDGVVRDLTAQPSDMPPPPPPPFDPELAQALPPSPPQLEDFVPLDPFALRPMERLAIYMRPMTQEELIAHTDGTQLYNDAADSPTADYGDGLATTTQRLRRESVLAMLDAYTNVFNVDPTSMEVDQNAAAAQRDHIKATLADAWTTYTATSASTEMSFREYLTADSANAEALAFVNGLRDMYCELAIAGVTPREMRTSLDGILVPITPESMGQDELEDAIDFCEEWRRNRLEEARLDREPTARS